MVKKYPQGATAPLDVKGIVSFFGGPDELARALEKHAIIGISPFAIKQWLYRKDIPASRRLDLQRLAAALDKPFRISRFFKKKKPPAAPKAKVA